MPSLLHTHIFAYLVMFFTHDNNEQSWFRALLDDGTLVLNICCDLLGRYLFLAAVCALDLHPSTNDAIVA